MRASERLIKKAFMILITVFLVNKKKNDGMEKYYCEVEKSNYTAQTIF